MNSKIDQRIQGQQNSRSFARDLTNGEGGQLLSDHDSGITDTPNDMSIRDSDNFTHNPNYNVETAEKYVSFR